MNTALWIIQIVLAVLFAAAGIAKLTQPREKLMARMEWAEDFTDGQVKAIGAVELLGAVGLVLPAATGILPWLTPLAAAGLAVTMVLAALVHVRRKEVSFVPVNLVLAALAAFVAWQRFGPQAF
jgi:uncharacterized membrane protein YphA (DoxX/SURF4 family)